MSESKIYPLEKYQVQCTISDPDRAKFFIEFFGNNTVPVKSMFMCRDQSGRDFYELDPSIITPELRPKIIEHIAKDFDLDIKFVEDNFDKIGIPILAKDCGITIHSPLCNCLLDDDNPSRDYSDWEEHEYDEDNYPEEYDDEELEEFW